MSRVVVLGASGMLGHKVCQHLQEHEVVGLVRREASEYEQMSELFTDVSLRGGVDVLDAGALGGTLREIEPDWVVNCVGLVKQLDEADDPYLAVAINSLLPHRLARLCEDLGAHLVHISTDCVFDGARGNYLESDLTDARDLYGRSKALGETVETERCAMTLRTSFIGRELKAGTHGLVEWFLAQVGVEVSGFDGVIYSGLTSLELAGVIRSVIDGNHRLVGVHHVASEPISKYDLLTLVRRTYDLDVAIQRSAEPVCDRSLLMSAFSEATGYLAPSWTEMIRQMHDDPTPYDAWKAQRENQL